MIRVELIYGRRSGWAAVPTVWLGVIGGVVAVVAALYFVPFAQLVPVLEMDELPLTDLFDAATDPPTAAQEDVLPAPVEASADGIALPPVSIVPVDGAVVQGGGAVVQGLVLPPVAAMASSNGVAIQSPAPVPSGSAPRRSTSCARAMAINKLLPAGIDISLLSCDAAGDYTLSGVGKSAAMLAELERVLLRLPSQVTLSSWRVGGVLHFSFAGHFADAQSSELATLSAAQAQRLFRKVEHWADQCGLDGISFHKPIEVSLSSTRARQRRKLRSTGSFQQINAFLAKLRQVEETARLGELILTPVRSGEHGWTEARLYVAVDAVVGIY